MKIGNRKVSYIWMLVCVLLFVSLTSAKRLPSRNNSKPLSLVSVHVIDHNGFVETITAAERLKQFQQADLSKSAPYQKLLRIYARDSKGDIRSIVTTYYPNGNIKQFLEVINARAYGKYQEWHENGKISLATLVIGGTPDITPTAQSTWLFNGSSCAWDENGNLLAEIPYSQGFLEGEAIYYHPVTKQTPAGQIWKKIPYVKNEMDGIVEIYEPSGELLQSSTYAQGVLQGSSVKYWNKHQIASQEEYDQGKLESGQYYDRKGQIIAEICQGMGQRASFGKKDIYELQDYRQGVLDGEIKVFNAQGRLKRIYHVKNNVKHGEEIDYYDYPIADSKNPSQVIMQPKLSFYWYEGKIQGIMKTWYSTGAIESQREMSNNAKNGILSAWYKDGNLMVIEEYDQDNLMRGDYFKKGEKIPTSQVIQGKGIATIFDADGNFIRKTTYLNGIPQLSK